MFCIYEKESRTTWRTLILYYYECPIHWKYRISLVIPSTEPRFFSGEGREAYSKFEALVGALREHLRYSVITETDWDLLQRLLGVWNLNWDHNFILI